MEHTALRPKPMPGREPGSGTPSDPARRPHAAHRRGRRLTTLLFGLFVGTVLVLAGAGLGAVGVTAVGMSRLAELHRQEGRDPAPGGPSAGAAPSRPTPSPAPAGATLGVEVVDAEKAGALVVGVHVPGPGYAAGLVRGDVLLTFGSTRIDTAADLARAVSRARPGAAVKLTVLHRSGGYQRLSAVPGVVT
ncbi:PDZ domain-containing protein [Streptomyces sp. S.PNR 29]|uniref:PDZ domain-containing protein n=1 Tax=Streptomyces sp. S.PNR 29 TaxID=2973805 RepID=UPI0025B0E44C|nr:PDZ domain-containing protein [Streptomyces sp. S.PNR 29]MDN0197293.1 PDZ domain-containing protein [Streptomyces sp. S.PNR 29]